MKDKLEFKEEEELREFLSANSYEEQLKILLVHAEKNEKIIQKKNLKNMESNNKQSNEKNNHN